MSISAEPKITALRSRTIVAARSFMMATRMGSKATSSCCSALAIVAWRSAWRCCTRVWSACSFAVNSFSFWSRTSAARMASCCWSCVASLWSCVCSVLNWVSACFDRFCIWATMSFPAEDRWRMRLRSMTIIRNGGAPAAGPAAGAGAGAGVDTSGRAGAVKLDGGATTIGPAAGAGAGAGAEKALPARTLKASAGPIRFDARGTRAR